MEHKLLTNEHFTLTKNGVSNHLDEEITEILYADLVTLRDNSHLIPGKQYRITDYVTTTVQEDTRSAGHQFDVIVMATDVNVLSESAMAALHSGDTYFAQSNLAAWELKYCLDNDADRFAWACPSKAVQIDGAWKPRYADGDVEGATYPYAWGTSSSKVFTASETPAAEDTAYAASDGTGDSYTIENVTEAGKGVIYQMVDEWGNDIPYDFKNILFKRYIASGTLFVSSNATELAQVKLSNFPGYKASNKKGLAARLCVSTELINGSTLTGDYVDVNGNTITIDSSAKYVQLTTGVYCPITSNDYYYTFTASTGDEQSALTTYARLNIMKPLRENGKWWLNRNVFVGVLNTNYTFLNYFHGNCYDNSFTRSTRNNVFYYGCYRNKLTGVEDSIFYAGSNSNVLTADETVASSTAKLIGYFVNNLFPDYIRELKVTYITNSLIHRFVTNISAGEIASCAICRVSNSIFGQIQNCIFDKQVYANNITIGNCEGIKFESGYYKDILIESGNKNITLTTNQTTSESVRVQNIKIAKGTNNSDTVKTISHNTVNDDFVTTYQPINSKIVNI